MAIDLTLKSVQITNRDATPRVLNNPGLGAGAREKVAWGHLASVTASLSITSVIRMLEIPSNAVVTSLRLTSAAQTAGAFDIGLYRTTADGGAVVDQDFFASGVSAAAAIVNTDQMNESTTNTIAKQGQRIWEAAGMTSDPRSMLDVCLTVAATDVTTGTGAIGLRVGFVD